MYTESQLNPQFLAKHHGNRQHDMTASRTPPSHREDSHENLRSPLGSCNAHATTLAEPSSMRWAATTQEDLRCRRGAPRRPARTPRKRRTPAGPSGAGVRSAHIEKRPPRARRPALPQPRAAVLSAKAGLTAGFGMGPGDPRLCGRARGGRSPAAQMYSSLPGTPVRGDPGGRMAGTDRRCASRSVLQSRMRRARAISAARLSASPRLHLRPIDQVVYLGPYRKVDSSRRRLPA